MVYRLKAGARLPVPAQAVGEELEAIRERNGGFIRAEQVLESANSDASPIHPCFQWDDAKAAHAHRLETAAYMLRSVVAVIEKGPDQPGVEVRAFVLVERDGHSDSEFTSVGVAMGNTDFRNQVLHRAKNELELWRRRYKDLKELSDVFSAIDDLIGEASVQPVQA
jgi:hypothetical protein